MRNLTELTEREILALAIGAEEEGRADLRRLRRSGCGTNIRESAKIFLDMSAEENEHRRSLIDLYALKFGQHIPLVRRSDVRGFTPRRPIWHLTTLGIDTVRQAARTMETESSRFYREAASRSTDTAIRKLLGDLAVIEDGHERTAGTLTEQHLSDGKREAEDDSARRSFVLRIVQPGLVGLMDGSVSTLAPVFAAAFATHRSWNAFLVGMAASIGAGISMGFAEALSDDGKISGRGNPLLRGGITGAMTTAGGIGHTLPYLIADFWTATAVAGVVVLVELAAISWIRWRYMETNLFSAALQIMVGGALVLACGVLIGSS